MIVPMKKVTLLTLAAHREASLGALRDLGVVHVTPLHLAVSGDVESARRQVDEARAIHAHLIRLAKDNPVEPAVEYKSQTPEHLLKIARGLTVRTRERGDRIQRLNDAIRHLEPLGFFDPEDLEDLVARGISIRLFKAEPKLVPVLPEDAFLVDLHRDKTIVYFAVIGAPAWSHPAAVEIPVPERSLHDLVKERDQDEHAQAGELKALSELAPLHPVIEKALAIEADHLHWLQTRDGMASEGPLLLLQGYMPTADLPVLQEEAKRQGWGWLAEEPADGENVPTLIRSPRWIRPIHIMFEMLGILPGYKEVDVSPIFLVFFSLFFAMLVGDAVYGLLFLGLTVLIKFKWKSAPRNMVPLLAILSCATIVWGILTGSYLGFETLPGPLNSLKIDWMTDMTKIQDFCFAVGAVHMSLAHGWNVWRLRKQMVALSHVGWIGSCCAMYSLARYLVLDLPLIPGTMPLLAISVVLILGFTVPFRDIKREYASLLTLPLSIISNFGDVVSYLRLYLVGSASVVLIKAFNSLAFPDSHPSIVAAIFGGIIIFFVHILNILLSSLAVLVHGVRLNALEFSTHMGIQWLGRKYDPFRKRLVS